MCGRTAAAGKYPTDDGFGDIDGMLLVLVKKYGFNLK
jgi:hypothetical protein